MYSDWAGPAVAGFLTIWLGALTFLVWQNRVFLTSIFPRSKERDVRKKFEEVIKSVSENKIYLNNLRAKLEEVERGGFSHIQNTALIRYNPYEDTGGDQSFTAAFLDKEGNGFVITSLHTRANTRVFAKPVRNGKAEKYEFSDEEQETVKKAMGKNT